MENQRQSTKEDIGRKVRFYPFNQEAGGELQFVEGVISGVWEEEKDINAADPLPSAVKISKDMSQGDARILLLKNDKPVGNANAFHSNEPKVGHFTFVE